MNDFKFAFRQLLKYPSFTAVAVLTLTRLITNQLFGVTATDPVTFAVVAVMVILVAVMACYLAAHRATEVDPRVALRHE